MILRSPITGAVLSPQGHALVAGGERWPVIDGIAFLRQDRRELADEALRHLDLGDAETACVCLLEDQDGWAGTPPPSGQARREAVRRSGELTFREAMDLLAFGPVATYFAHRWSDPTFLSGLALAQAFAAYAGARPDHILLEVACGAGHYLREFGPQAVGGDLVFAKLWLARHFVAPGASLVCFDAAKAWPFADKFADTVFCHDAFYFLPDKPHVAAEMQRVGRRALVGHMHNALVDNLSAGAPLAPGAYADLFAGCSMFDDRELTAALIEQRVPEAACPSALAHAPAVALAWNAGAPLAAHGSLTQPRAGTPLRRNPLYNAGKVQWPSTRYADEYSALATYPPMCDAPETALAGADANVDRLAQRRVLLDLPARW